MTYALKVFPTSLRTWCIIMVAFLFATMMVYGIMMVGTVKKAAAKEHFTADHANLSLEVGALENEFYAIKASYSAERDTQLVQMAHTSIVPTHTLGVAFRGGVR